jgi:heptosyltransferase III
LKSDSPATGKILIIRGGAIGDFILTLPVLSALRENFPNIPLEVLGYQHIAQLALTGGLARRVRSIDSRPLASFFAKGGNLSGELCEYFSGFALILSYLYDPDGIFRENVARCSEAQFLAGPHRPDENDTSHAAEVFLKPLEQLAIFDPDTTPRLRVGSDGSPVGRWLALHPGSGSERKNWPEEQWIALLELLVRDTKQNLLLIGGEAEGDRIQRLAARVPSARLELAFRLPLTDLASLLARSSGYIGHDSGISHLAAAVGLQGLVLWGDSREEIWRPRSHRMQLLNSPDGLANLKVEKVWSALQQHLLATTP